MNFLFYCLPAILILLVIFLIISILLSKKIINKVNKVIIVIIVVISTVLVVYYLPKDNILGKYNFSYIDIQDGIGIKGDRTIKDQNEINNILKVINKYTFTSSAVKAVEGGVYQSNEFITFHMLDAPKGKDIWIYVFNKQIKKNVLRINNKFYNVKDNEGFSKDIFDVIRSLK
jgi:hypothetical protein